MVVSVEGEDMDRDDFTNDAGWCEVRRRNTKKASEGTAGPTRPMPRDAAAPTRASGNSKWQGGRTIRQIIKASRLPHLPAEDYKVIVRPRGGLSVSEHRQARIYCCLRNAAGVGREAAEEGNAGSDEEGTQRPTHWTASQTTTTELVKKARTPSYQKDNDLKAHLWDNAVEVSVEKPLKNPIEIQGKVDIAIHAGRDGNKSTATKESTPIQATPTPAPTPVPAAPRGQTQPHKRKAKENADEQSGSTLEEVKGMFQEMFTSLQQQFVQMHADLQQQVMQMRIEVSQRFDTLDGRVVQLENAPKDARHAGVRPVKSKPYDRPPAAENSCKENASSQNGAA
ncbi:hypothetical protein HPB50_025930 [Hyalomma asiaticum]|uniref:Uncharacterized protein n=1 Tax=Hyalomma asiaticum TaxID=266040 RepID=A0ACB7S5P4_HYAAI|nr:hypothetical protein HPB50_025930 [Hyalomma asiaticum]